MFVLLGLMLLPTPFFFLSYSPPCVIQFRKQISPLPFDTQLRCGDLLCLSGRILSDIVASVNKSKAPEARGAALFVWFVCGVNYPPTPCHSALSHCLVYKQHAGARMALLWHSQASVPAMVWWSSLWENLISHMAFFHRWPCYYLSHWPSGQCPTPIFLIKPWVRKENSKQGIPMNVSQGDLTRSAVNYVQALSICSEFQSRLPFLVLIRLWRVHVCLSVSMFWIQLLYCFCTTSECVYVCAWLHNVGSQLDAVFKEIVLALERKSTHPGKRQILKCRRSFGRTEQRPLASLSFTILIMPCWAAVGHSNQCRSRCLSPHWHR